MSLALPRWLWTSFLPILVAGLLFAACGDDEDEPSSAAPSGETPAETAKAAPLDLNIEKRTIGVMCSVCQGEAANRSAVAARRAAELIGWDVQFVDGEGDPAKMQQRVAALVNSNVDAIVLSFMEPGPIAGALQDAKRADVPVVNVGFPSTPSEDILGDYVGDDAAATNLLVDRMLEDVGGSGDDMAKVASIDLPQYVGVTARMDAFREESEGRFEIVANHAVADLGRIYEETGQAGSDIIRANPDLDALFSCCDFAGQPLTTAVESSGKDLPVYSFYLLPSVQPLVKAGKLIVAEQDNIKTSFQAIYQLVRFFEEGTPLDPEEARAEDPPQAVIVDETNVPADAKTEVFPFEELWAPYAEKFEAEYGKS